jgi:anti-sigma B factor antagonist
VKIDIEMRGQVSVVHLEGRWDAQSSPEVEAAVQGLVQPGCRILLDLHGVEYMSSAGLRTLLLIYRDVTQSGGQIALARVTERLADVMEITGFGEDFEFYTSVDEGTSALQP